MELEIYHKTAESEDKHWWFIGRRKIVGQVLDRLALPQESMLLEVGCGSGGNLPLLSRYGKVYAMEIDKTALAYAMNRRIGTIAPGRLPEIIPFPEIQFDLMLMTDVLEHIAEDTLSLENLRRRLKPGGYLLLTVPAFQALWSRHDQLHHHQRRYRRDRLRDIVVKAGYEVVLASYINTFLFPAIAGLRLLQKLLQKEGGSDLWMPPAMVNRWLATIFGSEGIFLKFFPLPVGISLLVLARKPR
jgi:SAM-dependent methyltransferase